VKSREGVEVGRVGPGFGKWILEKEEVAEEREQHFTSIYAICIYMTIGC